ncbi:MAG: hypothetical protein ACYDCJ_13025 [Gammaproteobacteria bacterium]
MDIQRSGNPMKEIARVLDALWFAGLDAEDIARVLEALYADRIETIQVTEPAAQLNWISPEHTDA